jgi:hypothetical protein
MEREKGKKGCRDNGSLFLVRLENCHYQRKKSVSRTGADGEKKPQRNWPLWLKKKG